MTEGIGMGVEEPPIVTNEGGLDDLYARHIGAGIRLAFLLTQDRGHAEDLAQEAFVR